MPIKYAEIAEIIKLIEASSCDELVLETGDLKLEVRRGGAGGASTVTSTATPAPVAAPAPIAAPVVAPAPVPAAPAASSAPAPRTPRTDNMTEVCAPMVGTFYRAPSPDSPPFVEDGQQVKEGDPLCLIEVMKLFTTLSAQKSGKIVEICAENATLVEYDQVLFVIEPA